jgi:hypothetical protein
MKQKNCFFAVAASLLMAAASFTSCSNQDNFVGPVPQDPVFDFDEGSLIKNGQCEGNDLSCFWVNIGQDGGQYTGVPTTKWNGETPKDYCIVVVARSESEAKAAGNYGAQTWMSEPYPYADHDTQFFINFKEANALNDKDQIRITMDIKADEAFKAATGAHAFPGSYLSGFNNIQVPFTTEWTSFDTGWVTAGGNGPKAGTYSIAINLADTKKDHVNTFYFDNIRVEVKRFVPDPEPVQVEGMKVVFWNWGYADDTKMSTKYFKNYGSTTVEDGVIVVKSLEPGKNYNDQYYNESGQDTPIDAVLANDHDTQLLFSLPEKYPAGTKMRISMKVKADYACNIGAQCHAAIPAPGAIEKAGSDYTGTYLLWYVWSMGNTIPVTTEWTTFEKDFTVPNDNAINANGGLQSICLNLNMFKDAVNTYFFDDVTIYVEKGEEPIKAIDYSAPKGQDGSAVTGYPYYKMGTPDGTSYDVINGELVIENTKEQAEVHSLQPFILDWFSVKSGTTYKIRLLMKSSAAGSINLRMGTWSAGDDIPLTLTADSDYKNYEVKCKASFESSNNDVHILFQGGKFIGKVNIKKVEIFEE